MLMGKKQQLEKIMKLKSAFFHVLYLFLFYLTTPSPTKILLLHIIKK